MLISAVCFLFLTKRGLLRTDGASDLAPFFDKLTFQKKKVSRVDTPNKHKQAIFE